MKVRNFCIFFLLSAALVAAGFVLLRRSAQVEMQTQSAIYTGTLGAIVPHHAPLTVIIDGTLKKVSEEKNPKTIILIGPNHSDAGIGPALSTFTPWQLPGANVELDTTLIEQFVDEGLVLIDEKTLEKEHSMFTILPVIHKYFPQAKVVPIVLSSKHDKNRSKRLGEKIGSLLNDDTLIIASIDFSHYLSSDVAPLKDEETLSLIEKRDYETIERMPTAYFDSGPSVMTFLRAVDFVGPSKGELLYHTNSGLFAGEPILSSTSYMTFIFRR